MALEKPGKLVFFLLLRGYPAIVEFDPICCILCAHVTKEDAGPLLTRLSSVVASSWVRYRPQVLGHRPSNAPKNRRLCGSD